MSSLFRHLPDGTCWPVPGEALDELEWRLRYGGEASTSDRMCAASVVAAYRALIEVSGRRRAEVIRAIKGDAP